MFGLIALVFGLIFLMIRFGITAVVIAARLIGWIVVHIFKGIRAIYRGIKHHETKIENRPPIYAKIPNAYGYYRVIR